MSFTHFQDPEAAKRAGDRIEQLSGLSLGAFFDEAFVGNAAPDLALTNLERWLRTTSNPGIHMEQIAALPPMGRLLVTLLGASQPIADTLIQNPELGSLALDPHELNRKLDTSQVRSEGMRLLSSATSNVHALDRLRFLKQRWNLSIVLNDLAGTWDQETVWLALSDLADALIGLTQDVVWRDYSHQKDLTDHPSWMIVAFGKLGGRELNYSSDVDLVYVVDDGLDEKVDRDCTRYFESFGRGLSNRMGRGSLYRVDLRLRPYGGAGPIIRSMRAFEAYYQLYAEPWEVQALVRSRPVVGNPRLCERWEAMRISHCFRPKVSEMSLEHMLAMKARIEQGAIEDDLKRGEGGIRDVEFLTQIMQMIHGYNNQQLRVRATCEALRNLEQVGLLEPSVTNSLVEGYRFLRKLEHRLQLVGDQQTHTLPASVSAREGLARLMGSTSWAQVGGRLDIHRRTIQTLFRSTLSLEAPSSADRRVIQEKLGSLGMAGLHWFDGFPESEAFYKGLVENDSSLDRILKILTDSPKLVSYFRSSLSLTELLMSGEILEIEDVSSRVRNVSLSSSPEQLADVYLHGYVLLLSQWTLAPDFSLGYELSNLLDALIEHCAKRFSLDFSIIALGSFGLRELSPQSDGDLLFLIGSREGHPGAERQAQDLLAFLGQLKRLGAPISFDLRLRPEGGKGLLVRTYEGLKQYDLDGMEMWERFALGQGRLVTGAEEAIRAVLHCAYGMPLTPERLLELTKMKRRVETERVKPQHLHREVKLGSGGLSDIEWLVHLNEMRYLTATRAGGSADIKGRIYRLVEARAFNVFEAETLINANIFLRALRARLFLIGIDDDLLPENPDRLDRLAKASGFADGNSLLSRHQSVVEPVRRMYVEGLERLKL